MSKYTDKEELLDIIKDKPCEIEYASYDLKNDKDIASIIVEKDGYNLKYLSDKIRNNNEIVMKAVELK